MSKCNCEPIELGEFNYIPTNSAYFMVDVKGNIIGGGIEYDYEGLKWYQKLFCKISKTYNSRFLIIKPIELGEENSQTINFQRDNRI